MPYPKPILAYHQRTSSPEASLLPGFLLFFHADPPFSFPYNRLKTKDFGLFVLYIFIMPYGRRRQR